MRNDRRWSLADSSQVSWTITCTQFAPSEPGGAGGGSATHTNAYLIHAECDDAQVIVGLFFWMAVVDTANSTFGRGGLFGDDVLFRNG